MKRQKHKRIRVAPEQWTTHHTDRAVHTSGFFLALAFVLITSWILGTALGIAKADTSLNSGVGAHVLGIDEGPEVIVGGGGGGSPAVTPGNNPTPVPPGSLQAPWVSADIILTNATSRTIFVDGQQVTEYVINTQFPSFHGQTNIKNAVVGLDIASSYHIKASVKPVGEDWYWKVPQPVSVGHHILTVSVGDTQVPEFFASTQFYFAVELPPGQAIQQPANLNPSISSTKNLYSVDVTIPEKFKQLRPGNEVAATIKLSGIGQSDHSAVVVVQYQVQDANGQDVIQSAETLAVPGNISYLKSFSTSPQLAEGRYTVVVSVSSKNAIVTSSDYFELATPPVAAVTQAPQNNGMLFALLSAMLLLFGMVAYWEYNKVKMLTAAIAHISGKQMAKIKI